MTSVIVMVRAKESMGMNKKENILSSTCRALCAVSMP